MYMYMWIYVYNLKKKKFCWLFDMFKYILYYVLINKF